MHLKRHLWWKRVCFNVRKEFYAARCWKITIKRRKWKIKKRKWKWETRNQKWESRNNKWEKAILKKNIVKGEPKEIKSPNWIDKNKFKKMSAIIDSDEFVHKNRIGEFKYIKIKDLVTNIKNITISEIDAKKI